MRGAHLTRPGCVVHYRRRESTSGRWVVFLHGAGMDGRMFDAQVEALPREVGIACWDARGHGRSRLDGPFRYGDLLDDLHALVDGLDARDLTLVGHSMGGNLAQSYVDARPGAAARLVLVDCTANHGPLSRLDRLALRSTRLVLTMYPWDVAVRQSARACGVEPATVAYAERCLSEMGKDRFIEVMDFWREALDPRPGHRMPVPTLALVGDHDRSGNVRAALTRLATDDPRVTLAVIDDAGHNAPWTAPSRPTRRSSDSCPTGDGDRFVADRCRGPAPDRPATETHSWPTEDADRVAARSPLGGREVAGGRNTPPCSRAVRRRAGQHLARYVGE